jgi:phospholipid transport system substrate-binding protein
MKKTTLLFTFLFSLASFSTIAIDKTDPQLMTEAVLSKAFQAIKNSQPAIKEDSEVLKKIITKEVMPYVNHKFSSLYVMGSHFRKITKAERFAFADAFRGYMGTQLAHLFSFYHGQDVTFVKSHKRGKKTHAVKMIIKEQGRPDISIQLKLRIDKKTGEWAAYDLVAEGISMIQSKRSEFARTLRQDGVPALTKSLLESNKKPFVIKRD